MKRLFTFSLLGLLGLLAALFSFRLQVGDVLITRLLEQAGGTNVRVNLTELNSRKIAFSSVDCTLPENHGRLSLKNATFTWDGTTLKKRQLKTISIERLAVDIKIKNRTPSKHPITIDRIVKQIALIRQRLPFRTLIIKHLTLNGSAAGGLAGRDLALRLQKNDPALFGELGFADQRLALTLNSVNPTQWNLNLQEPGQDEPFFSARINLEDEPIQAEIETDLARLEPINTLFKKPLPKMEGKLDGTLTVSLKKEPKTSLMLRLQKAGFAGTTAALVKLALHGRLDTAGRLQVGKHSFLQSSGLEQNNKKISIAGVQIGLDGILERIKGRWQFNFAPETIFTASGLKGPGLNIQSVKIVPAMMAILSKEKMTLNLQPEWWIRLTGIKGRGLSVPEAELRPDHEVKLSVVPGPPPAWSIAPSRWQWTTDRLHVRDMTIDPAPVYIDLQQLTGSSKKQRMELALSTEHLGLTNKDIGLAVQNITAGLSVDGDRITGKASFSPNVPGTLSIRFSHDLQHAAGKATLNSSEPLTFSEMSPLSTLLGQWPFAFNLTGGSLQVRGSIGWRRNQPLRASVQTQLVNGKGTFKEMLFSGLATQQDLQLLPTIQSRKNGSVAIDTLETGVTVKNIAMETGFTPSPHGKIPQIILRNLSASLFGGTISDDLIIYDPQQPDVRSTLHLNNINLAALVTTQQVKGLDVTGRIKGTLPFILDQTGLRIDKGTLGNTPGGGLIRYTLAGNNGLKESPLTGYALKALEEFHYSLLSATARYRPDGELQVSLHLEGKSPKLDTDRPVHLNINTEQNLLSLLKSLRYSTSLTDEIDKEIQQHYRE